MAIDLEKLRKDPHIITSDTAGAALNRHNNNGEFARFIKKNIMECDFDGDTYMIGPNPNTYGNGEVGVLQKVGNKWVWSWHNTITTNWSSHLVIYETYNLVCKNYLGLEPLSNEEILSSVDTVYEKLTSLFETFRNEIFTPISTKKTSPFWQMYFICQNTWNKSLIDEIKFIRSVFDNDVTVVKSYERGSASDIRGGVDFTVNDLTYQHKSISFLRDGEYYILLCYINKSKHSGVNRLVFENSENYYLFNFNDIVDDNDAWYDTTMNGFYINKERLMEKENLKTDELSSILYDIHRICLENRIPFHLVNEDCSDIENEVTFTNGEVILKIKNIMDIEFANRLIDVKKELLNTFN